MIKTQKWNCIMINNSINRAIEFYLDQLTAHDEEFVEEVFKDFMNGDYSDATFWLSNEQSNIESGAEEGYDDFEIGEIASDKFVEATKLYIKSMDYRQCIKKFENYWSASVS